METVLSVKKLNKSYAKFAIKDISFELKKGSIMAFIGRNGAGKTTTIKSMLNFIHTDSGEIEFFGLDNIKNQQEIKQRIGYAGGGIDYYLNKKLKDIAKHTKPFYVNWDNEAYEKYMKVFMLDENKKVKELSAGMRVKFNICLALSHHAEILILDEPTSGLDPVSRDEFLDIIEKLSAKGVSTLFSTHITSDLEKCATHVTYIKEGRILLSDTKEEFVKKMGGGSLEDIMIRLEKREVEL